MKYPNVKVSFMRTSLNLLATGVALLVLNFQLHAQMAYAPAVNYGVGSSPSSVTVADINGDGKVDLICANRGSVISPTNTLSVLTNNGSGLFGYNATYAVGSAPYSVTAADVNGDGKVDLISANLMGSSLSVLTNNGCGGFVLASTLATIQPNSVIAADVNGDGHVDLICANEGYGALSVFTNTGGGGFAFAGTNDVGFEPKSVVASDINGDGHVDLICANAGIYQLPQNVLINGNTLSVLTNDSNGSFALASTLNVGIGPSSVTTADINGDGKVDLICANSDNTISVLIAVPTPTINLSSINTLVSWPSGWTNWTLQQNADLTTTNWSACSGVIDDGTNQRLTLPSPPGSLFFRLAHP